jgi:type IV pilus assembly protein PilQ
MTKRDAYMNTFFTKTNTLKNIAWCFLLIVTCSPILAQATTNEITSLRYSALPGNRIQVVVNLSSVPEKPLSFTIDNPARIAFDFKNTVSKLKKRNQPIGLGIADSITTISAKNKTRVILNLTEVVPYDVQIDGKQVTITLDSEASESAYVQQSSASSRFDHTTRGIKNIDFRRGEKGEGRVIINMTDANIPMDISEQSGKVIVRLIGANLPEELTQRLDVIDFATPVKAIDSFVLDNAARLEITPVNRNFEHLAYQTDKTFIIEFKPISKEEKEEAKKAKFGYIGERLSLNFQDIPIRAVLQLIADFTGLNIVVSDSVDGNLTLRLKNVPWDQALDIILKAKGLGKRENGNVVLVAPSEEIAAQEKMELEAKKQVIDLAPIRTAYFQINFAKVTDLEKLFGGGGEGGEGSAGLLSERGKVIIDERTNSILIKDTDDVISEIRRILTKLDVPVRQVLIESRIVIATDDFVKELGIRFGATYAAVNGSNISTSSGTMPGTNQMVNASGTASPFGTTGQVGVPDNLLGERLNVNMPASAATGSIAFAILTGSNLIDLELSAREAEKTSEIVASPRVVTADRNEAFIESGVEIPYEEASSSGATTISFKKAVLSIKVTPQITPDDRVILDLSINKDAVGEVFGGIPSIDTREIQTQVLVNNGDTVVLGGIYESDSSSQEDKVPVLGDLPLIGALFRHSLEVDNKAELLIFVTPKILKDSLSL